jgi:uncharacterized SAM-binding protein YcdF (DUF218 family)
MGWRGIIAEPFRGRRWRVIASVVAVFFIVFCAATARLFVWPATGMPARVDAIVVLGGQGSRLDYALRLASEDRASYLVLSKGLPWITPGLCTNESGPVKVICFQPTPGTTQGEAEATGRLAKRYGWRSIVLVTTPDQTWRAELRFRRCYGGEIYGVTTPLPKSQWPYAIAYQWAATMKAEVVNRGC